MPGALAETLADLRRADDVLRMRLPGLSDDEVSDLVSRAAGGHAAIPSCLSSRARFTT